MAAEKRVVPMKLRNTTKLILSCFSMLRYPRPFLEGLCSGLLNPFSSFNLSMGFWKSLLPSEAARASFSSLASSSSSFFSFSLAEAAGFSFELPVTSFFYSRDVELNRDLGAAKMVEVPAN